MNTSTSSAVKLSNREFYQQRTDAALPGVLFEILREIQKGHCFFSYNGVHPPQRAVESPIASMESNSFVFTNQEKSRRFLLAKVPECK